MCRSFLGKVRRGVGGEGRLWSRQTVPSMPLLLLKPQFGVSTPWAYQRWRDSRELPGVDFAAQSVGELSLQNDLERPVFEKHIFLAQMKGWLRDQPGGRGGAHVRFRFDHVCSAARCASPRTQSPSRARGTRPACSGPARAQPADLAWPTGGFSRCRPSQSEASSAMRRQASNRSRWSTQICDQVSRFSRRSCNSL